MKGVTRPISWIKAARKEFERFPAAVQMEALRALTIAADGEMADVAKPLHGLGAGVMELALRHRGDAWRVVYAVQMCGWSMRFRRNRKAALRHLCMRSIWCGSASSD